MTNTGPRSDSAGPIRSNTPRSHSEYAQAYANQLDWAVLPLQWITADGTCSCGASDCRSPGKHPISNLVRHGVKDATKDPRVIAQWWSQYPDANVGIAMGAASDVWALDVDPRNGGDDTLSELEDKHGALPDTIQAITGSGGYHYLFRHVHGGNKPQSPGAGIDVKADGGYVVVEPSNHLQGHYAWEGSADPLDGIQSAYAPRWLLSQSPVKTGGTAAGYLDEDRVRELRSALGYISADDYDEWIAIGQALHSTEAGPAYGLWNEWSQTSDKYDARETAKKWRSFTAGGGLNVESIFAKAQACGWVNPATARNQEWEQTNADLIERANSKAQVEIVDRPPVAPRRIPVPILSDLQTWIASQLPINYPHATCQAVLSIASSLASRHYLTSDGDPPHTYLGILCRSVGDVRRIKSLIHKLLAECDQRRMIRGTRMGSAVQVYRTLFRAPVTHYVADDWGQMLAFARRQPSGVIEAALNVMADAYQARDMYLDPDLDATFAKEDQNLVIYHPALSILAVIAEDQVGNLVKQSEFGRGALEQFLIVDAGEMQANESVSTTLPLPPELKDLVQRLRPAGHGAGNLVGMQGKSALLPFDPHVVHLQIDHRRTLSDIDHQLHELVRHDPRLMSLGFGARQIVRRLVLTLAAWNCPEEPKITTDIIEWCGSYISDHLGSFIERVDIARSDSGELDIFQKITAVIVESGAGGVTGRDLARRCRAYRSLSIEERTKVLETLKGDDEIYYKTTQSKRGGRPSTRLVHRRYVKEQK